MNDRSDKFTFPSTLEFFTSSCQTCRWLDLEEPTRCAAYPKGRGIPEAIRFGSNDHTKPYRGDNGIQYAPLPPKNS